MRVTLDNMESPSNLITFTDIPNILKVEDTSGGTYATMTFTFSGDLAAITTANSQWHITFLDETITNSLLPQNAVNKSFYISSNNVSTASSVAKAFRNCSSIAAAFDVIFEGGSSVVLRAKAVGSIWTGVQNYLITNIDSTYLTTNGVDGSADSELNGAVINVDIYNDNNYVTTLEKSYYGSEAAFNLSPILTTVADYGYVEPYTIRVSSIKNGEYSLLGNIDTNYIAVGYMVNQGYKYINTDAGIRIAMNYSRGAERDVENNTILYVYEPKIKLSIYKGDNTSRATFRVEYLDSAYNLIGIYDSYINLINKFQDLNIDLDERYYGDAFYVDVTIGNTKIRFNVIKPIKATDYCQRIYWRNSYGGISFFDFTGQKSETREINVETYQKNIFGYYTDEMNELEKAYDNSVKYTVTLKSHLFENDGKYVFNDLIQSANVWTEINGHQYAIIIESVSVDEVNNNNIYEATVKYRYSQTPSLV
jgi:hypothetical protein